LVIDHDSDREMKTQRSELLPYNHLKDTNGSHSIINEDPKQGLHKHEGPNSHKVLLNRNYRRRQNCSSFKLESQVRCLSVNFIDQSEYPSRKTKKIFEVKSSLNKKSKLDVIIRSDQKI
jgi:hypothetical protein